MEDNILFGACLLLYCGILVGSLVKIIRDGRKRARQASQPRIILRAIPLQREEPLHPNCRVSLYMQQVGRAYRQSQPPDYKQIYLNAISDLEEEWKEKQANEQAE